MASKQKKKQAVPLRKGYLIALLLGVAFLLITQGGAHFDNFLKWLKSRKKPQPSVITPADSDSGSIALAQWAMKLSEHSQVLSNRTTLVELPSRLAKNNGEDVLDPRNDPFGNWPAPLALSRVRGKLWNVSDVAGNTYQAQQIMKDHSLFVADIKKDLAWFCPADQKRIALPRIWLPVDRLQSGDDPVLHIRGVSRPVKVNEAVVCDGWVFVIDEIDKGNHLRFLCRASPVGSEAEANRVLKLYGYLF